MNEEDILDLIIAIGNKLDMMSTLISSVNVKLNQLTAQKIGEGLKAEEGDISVQNVVGRSSPPDPATESQPSEEVLMDLTKVTVMVITKRAVLVTKQGFQKWIPISQIDDGQDAKEGDYLENLKLTEKGKWIDTKPWDKLEVRKR